MVNTLQITPSRLDADDDDDILLLAAAAAPSSPVLESDDDTDTDADTDAERQSPKKKRRTRRATFDAQAYLDKRVMTPMQERFNAITMLPGMIYSLYYILAGCWWVTTAGRDQQQEHDSFASFQQGETSDWTSMAQEAFGNEHAWIERIGCINSSLFPHLTALPPLPVVAAAVGILVHSPFSMLYHWKYATVIKSSQRVQHWSRRLDHAFIHFASSCAAYATSGRVDFFLLNAMFNLDCAYRQFEEKVRPRRNLSRIVTSVHLYLLPLLVYGHYALFLQFYLMFTVGGWVSSHLACVDAIVVRLHLKN